MNSISISAMMKLAYYVKFDVLSGSSMYCETCGTRRVILSFLFWKLYFFNCQVYGFFSHVTHTLNFKQLYTVVGIINGIVLSSNYSYIDASFHEYHPKLNVNDNFLCQAVQDILKLNETTKLPHLLR